MTHARIGTRSLEIDLPLRDGITAMYGPAGAGKTAVLGAIAGFVRPERGRILIDDAIVFDAEGILTDHYDAPVPVTGNLTTTAVSS